MSKTGTRFTDLEKIDFLECYIRNNNDLHGVCSEYGLKYNTAAMRLSTIKKEAAKRRGEEVAPSSGRKKSGSAVKASGSGGKKLTPASTPSKSKKRKVMSSEGSDEGEEVEENGGADEDYKGSVKKEKGAEIVDEDYDFA